MDNTQFYSTSLTAKIIPILHSFLHDYMVQITGKFDVQCMHLYQRHVTNTEWKISMHVANGAVSKTCYNLQMIKGVTAQIKQLCTM